MDKEFLKVENLEKSYGGVTVLRDFSLTIRPGEVHALIGHNGAGKSTVIRMLSGSQNPSSGKLYINGSEVALSSPRSARNMGIYTVFQELRLIDELTITENFFLGKEIRVNGFINKREMVKVTSEVLSKHNLGHLNVLEKAKSLSHASKQLVEIVSALNNDAKLILLDEPTTALQMSEIQDLLQTIRILSRIGISFLFITHKIDEAFSVCTHLTILRNGQMISSSSIDKTNRDEVLASVAGKKIVTVKKATILDTMQSDVALEVSHLKSDVLDIQQFKVNKGEVIGIYGLVGSGRTEFLETIYGARKYISGNMRLNGYLYRPKSPIYALRHGVLLLTEERKQNGIIPQLSSRINMILANLRQFNQGGFLQKRLIKSKTDEFINKLSIKGDMEQPIERLSGGNQQKVLLARWLLPEGQLLMLDEPTKGVDIGVKTEIHMMIRDLAKEGYAVLVVSSEVEEIIAVSDVVAVMNTGKISSVLRGSDIIEEKLLTESMEGIHHEV